MGDAELEVPSPSFSLVQAYSGAAFGVTHADLYRLSDAAEAEELGLSDALDGGILILEWPERLGGALPANRLELTLALDGAGGDGRFVEMAAHGAMAARFAEWKLINAFLMEAGFGDAERIHIQGDAGARRYERLIGSQGSAILMIAPPRTDNKPVRAGRSYLQIAHLSETVHAFLRRGEGAARQGLPRAAHLRRAAR